MAHPTNAQFLSDEPYFFAGALDAYPLIIIGKDTLAKIIKYGLIIAVLSIAISVLMFINNKSDKFDIKRGKNGKK